jgi:P27 family predicted phage terminase small subunit
MGRGRKPEPTELKILKGSRRSRINMAALSDGSLPEPPEHLDAVARAEWDRMIQLLKGTRVVNETDGSALAVYCVAYSQWVKAGTELKGPIKYGTGAARLETKLLMDILKQSMSLMMRVLVEFGFTPASRSKASFHRGTPRDELGEFLSARDEHAGPRRWRNADKRQAILTALAEHPKSSNRAIAEQVGVSPHTVESARSSAQFARRGGDAGRKETHR